MRNRELSEVPARLLSSRAAAAWLGVEPKTLSRWAREGKVPHYRVGRRILRFSVDEVVAALREGQPEGGRHATR